MAMAYIVDDQKGKTQMEQNRYETAEIHAELLNMMKRIHAFCEEKDIRYSLCGGSLLGAIRHNGFIPWDDDIDIWLDRENYEKLLKEIDDLDGFSIHRELWIMRLQSADVSAQEGQYIPTVDLFVMDHAPKNSLGSKCKVLTIKILQGMMKKNVKYRGQSFFHRVLLFVTHVIGLLFTDSFKWKMYQKVSMIGNKKETELVGCYNDIYRCLDMTYPKDTMEKLELHQFEDTEFYLRLYGILF